MRKVECRYCKGEVLVENVQKTTSSQPSEPRKQNVLKSIGDLLSLFTGGPKKVPRREALGGECSTCGNTGFVEDVTDTSDADKAAADYLASKADRILELESKLGNSLGGNQLCRVAGAKIEIIGRTLNTAKSYTVHKGKGAARDGAKLTADGRPALPVGPEKGKGSNVITGNNVPANTGGGLYFIQCGNKFKLVSGSQGIEFSSTGPITFDGGMVRFTGAEVSVGSKTGPLLVEGDSIEMVSNAGSINFTPGGAGTVGINGSIAAANIQAGGIAAAHAFLDGATMPERQEITKVSSGNTDLVNGPALWGGESPSGKLKSFAVKNAVKMTQDFSSDPALAGGVGPLNPRNKLKMNDNMASIAYSEIPFEGPPTGYILEGAMIEIELTGIPGLRDGENRLCSFDAGAQVKGKVVKKIPLNNFPHEHGLPDQPHGHNFIGPAINSAGNTSKSVQESAVAAGINSRVPAQAGAESGNTLAKLQAFPGQFLGALNNIGTAVKDSLDSPYNT